MGNRAAALAAGQTRFFTGEPCRRGHVAERLTANSACSACEYERKVARAKTPEGAKANREYQRRYLLRNPEPAGRGSARARAWKLANPVRYRELRRAYDREKAGLPLPERPCPESCEACGRTQAANGKALALDHCHETGKFRGWLCDKCNRGLGFLGDNADGVRAALEYLLRAAKP